MLKKKLKNKAPLLIISAVGVMVLAVSLILGFDNKKNMRAQPDANQKPKCVVAGCSGQYCVENNGEPTISTCEWKAEYACYKTAKCEIQANGKCGFRETDELKNCLLGH